MRSHKTPAWLNTGTKIMPLGDSITEGWPSDCGGYRAFLYNMFVEEDIPVDFVGSLDFHSENLADKNHEGHAGWTTLELASGRESKAECAPEWVRRYDPAIVLLIAGTNDLFYTNEAEEIANNYMALLASIRAAKPGIVVIAGTIPPICYNMPSYNNTATQANNLIRGSISSLADNNVILCDTNSALIFADISQDGIHINARGDGNRKIAEAFFVKIKSVLESL